MLTKVMVSDDSTQHATIAAMALSNLLDLDSSLESDPDAIEKLISTVRGHVVLFSWRFCAWSAPADCGL